MSNSRKTLITVELRVIGNGFDDISDKLHAQAKEFFGGVRYFIGTVEVTKFVESAGGKNVMWEASAPATAEV